MTLGLTDVEEHTWGVDVFHTKPADLPEPETGRVQNGDQDTIAQRPKLCENSEHLAGREDDGVMLLAAAVRDADDQVGPVYDVKVEEAEGTDGLIEQAVRDLLLIAKEEEVPLDLGKAQTIWSAMKEQSETRDEREVCARGAGREVANAERLQHPLTQGSRDHDRSPFNEIRSVNSRAELEGEPSSVPAPRAQQSRQRGARRVAASSNSSLHRTRTSALRYSERYTFPSRRFAPVSFKR